uniref:Synaptobrevin, longin-like domain protein n=1 Tax=Tanacetum cinerariifolium TaxID=118510 RepID=A0A6L2P7W9_TANCI|nr:hypothetical protein [Tanacetum cinerariifolium]
MNAKMTAWNEFSSSMASAVICLSTGRKFNFSKYIFDILFRNVDSSSKFYMYPRFLQLMIAAQVGDLTSHTTKYTSPALTQNVFANMRRLGKGFSRVNTPLFKGMLVPQQVDVDVDDVVAASVHVDDAADVVANDVATDDVADVVGHADAKPTLPRVENLEQDMIAQALEITKLKQKVKRLEKQNKLKVSWVEEIEEGEIIELLDTDEDVTLEEVAAEVNATKDAEVDKNADVQGRLEESQAQVYHIDLEHADKVLITAATTPIIAATITATPSAARRRKGVVIRDPKETATPSTIVHSELKAMDKGKGILVEEPKPLKKQAQIEQCEAYARELEAELNKNINWDDVIEQLKRKEKEDNVVLRYQSLKRKPQTEAQARKNMMVYLKNMTRFKMDFFKRMSYHDIRPIYEKYFNSNVAFLKKSKEELEEEGSRALKRKTECSEEKAAKKQKLDEEVEVLKKHLQIVPNDEDDVYTEANGTDQLFLSFLSLLRNFDREDLEMLWQIVRERFASSKPKNFSDDFLLTTLKSMFEKPDVEAQVWKYQKEIHSLAKVKRWRLLESCGVHIITFITTQMILLVERRYILTRFTLDQMLINVRLEVEEESEVSLELLRFIRRQQQEEYRP